MLRCFPVDSNFAGPAGQTGNKSLAVVVDDAWVWVYFSLWTKYIIEKHVGRSVYKSNSLKSTINWLVLLEHKWALKKKKISLSIIRKVNPLRKQSLLDYPY